MSCLKERKKKLLVLESESCSAVTKHEGLWDSLAVGPLLLLKFEGLCLKQALLFGFCMLRVWNGIPVLVQSLLFLLTLPLLLPQGSFCHYHPGEEVMWSCFCCHPWLTLPVGTGPVWPVTGQTGPDRFRFRPVPNRSKFKFWIWIQKNEKFSKNS